VGDLVALDGAERVRLLIPPRAVVFAQALCRLLDLLGWLELAFG
jgi:hypothetical protein